MTCVWMEGFELHQSEAQLARKYATADFNSSSITTTGRVFGTAHNIRASILVTPSLGLANTYVIGFGLRVTGVNGSLDNFEQGLYLEKGNDEQVHLQIIANDADGFTLELRRGSTTLATSAKIAYGNWNYFELKVTVDPSSGAYELRQNEVTILSATGVNTADEGTAQADILAIRYAISATQVQFDDIYVLNTLGTENNDFLGDSVVEGILPDGNGDTIEWTNDAGSGSNYQNVDDTATSTDEVASGGTNSSDNNGDIDLYAFEDLTQAQGNIHAVQVGIQLGMSAAGSRVVRGKFKDAVDGISDGDSFTVDSTTFDEFTQVYDENPSSAAGWDVNDIDDGQFGVEVVS